MPNSSISKTKQKELGPCPICGRMMILGPSTDRHHWIPKSQNGEDWNYLHRVCHKKIHSLYTEKFLAKEMNSPEKLLQDEDIQKFVKWVRKQPIESIGRIKKNKNGKRYK
ncbi:HNH endonuclease, partial [Curvivirga aplysinae]|uniref:HNH endonuclease n=1 Tax=Curvivirga aplysinae TaxID=2529852 RepID=UPI001C3FE68F